MRPVPGMRGGDLRALIAAELTRTRARTDALVAAVDADDLHRQHSPLMSPLVWDYAHIANQEDYWLVRRAGAPLDGGGVRAGGTDDGGRRADDDAAAGGVRPDLDDLYNAFRHARRDRGALDLLDEARAREYVHAVRQRTLEILEATDLDRVPAGDRLRRDGFVWGMVIQHENQHDETMLATHQLRATGDPLAEASLDCDDAFPPPAPEVVVPAGTFTMGTDGERGPGGAPGSAWALDNERPAHAVYTEAYAIDTLPVSVGRYLEFMADGGYDNSKWWSDRGWAHRVDEGLVAPLFWTPASDTPTGWVRRRFGLTEPLPPEEPVVHVCFYEAEAFANWAGRRLPTEAEWEKAARWDPVTGHTRTWPWGEEPPTAAHANLAGADPEVPHYLQTTTLGTLPAGATPAGVAHLIGDVWEWCDSPFLPYPGFEAFPYKEYSEVFFEGDYRMLRGGSFATDVTVGRATFRNWDHPVRRQIFSGFRTVRDVTADEARAAGPGRAGR